MRLRLIHWNAGEARDRAGALARAGHEVSASPFTPQEVRKIKTRPPEAILIDLSRLPSQGRDAALLLRQTKTTRRTPLVFVEGDPAKVAAIQKILPDAVYTAWPEVASAIKDAVANPPAAPLVPGVFAGYAGASLAKKLGIKAGSTVVLMNGPQGFERELRPLPPRVTLRRNTLGRRRDLTLWFVRSRQELERGIAIMKVHATAAGLWIVWPKRKSAVADISQVVVRKAGLAAGIVDFKIASLDAEWSGLRFTSRKPCR